MSQQLLDGPQHTANQTRVFAFANQQEWPQDLLCVGTQPQVGRECECAYGFRQGVGHNALHPQMQVEQKVLSVVGTALLLQSCQRCNIGE